ncbi:DUF2975 domain-containing protein [bacterium 1xD42-67]|nr:DUF2975 domain-containing protein [bacterium 1xD42-67]
MPPHGPPRPGGVHRPPASVRVLCPAPLVRPLRQKRRIDRRGRPLCRFVPAFFIRGLLFLVMSALFRQAAELKEDQDLTI